MVSGPLLEGLKVDYDVAYDGDCFLMIWMEWMGKEFWTVDRGAFYGRPCNPNGQQQLLADCKDSM